MQKHLNKIKALPLYVQGIISALPSVILIALFIFFIYLPKSTEIETMNAKVVKLSSDIKIAEAKVKRLDALIIENEQLKKKLARLKEQLPEEKEVSVLLRQVSEAGRGAGMEILFWKPEPKKTNPEGLYVEIPVKVEVIAQYHRFGDFLSLVSRLPRLVNISDIVIKNEGKGNEAPRDAISVTFKARTFASVTKTGLPQGNDKGKK